MAARVASKILPSGHKIPVIGLGVYQSEPGAETYNAVLSALKLGYRHIDTAQFYRNEADVGKAIRDAGLEREDVFVTSKHFSRAWSYDEAMRIVQQSVANVGGGYIDLYLLHAPGRPEGRADAWRALEDAQAQGLVRDIGVSNYGQAHLEALAETWRVKPAVNQIELHPWLTRTDVVAYCTRENIHLQAYSPLVRAHKMEDATLLEVARQASATPAQVLIAWSLAKGFITLPKSIKPHRQRENLDAKDVTLSDAQVATLDALDEYFVTGWDPIKEHKVRSSMGPILKLIWQVDAPVPTKTLPSGRVIPALGLGVFQSRPGDETYNAVRAALAMGYRHIDTAEGYSNEADVGRAIADSGIPRDEVFVTSKYMGRMWSYDDVLRAVNACVRKIGGGYVDLFLLHAPSTAFRRADAWRALEDAQAQGLVRDIGVSNFGEAHLKLAESWRVKPAANQIELHPWLGRQDTVKYCEEQGILLEAYSPLARAYKMKDATVVKIAGQTNATPAQVLVAWSLAKGFITIPKSVKPERQRENLEGYKIQLSAAQIADLDALDKYMVTCWDPIKDHPV